MTTRILILQLLVLVAVTASHGRQRSQFTRFRSWNTRMYPAWKEGDPRFRNCWKGGNVTFELKNDAPTLSGAKATFNINLNFPSNQTVLSNGTVVWAQNCTVDGQQYQAGQPVYPDTQGTAMFPDGTPIRAQRRPQKYVYVWKTWGRFWQVADGPSSSLSIGTENIPMGSYDMELVIYHQRGKSNFIPLGYASSRFTITDQVPFTISMSQVNDLNVEDQSFIQNRAVAFSVNLHDPSQYLSAADLSFTWDFGDNTGTLISRDRTVTHTYQTVGSFKPQVILMASIPTCGNPTAVVPVESSAAPAVVVVSPAAVPDAEAPAVDTAVVTDADTTADADTEEAAAVETVVTEDAAAAEETVDTAEATEGEVATAEEAAPEAAVEDATAAVATEETVDEAAPIAEEAPVTEATPVLEDAPVEAEAAEVETVTEGAVVVETEAAADNTVAAAATVAPETAPEAPLEGEVVAEVAETENVVAATVAAAEAEAELPLVIAKRQAPELTADCTVYRYGSLATSVQVVQGIESVEIVQVSNVMSLATALDQNAVDVTVSCQGSLPSEVCTVVSDADCVTPVQTLCSVAVPTPDCQLVLRQFFNDTGIFCLNVSLTNDVSLAVTSARVNVNMATTGSPAGTAATVLGVMVLACVVCCVGLMYRRLKQYQPLVEESGSGSVRTSVPMLLWNLLTRQSPGESRPLLHGRIV
ncbi:premelanosome protein a isoform X3 [Periophthalmus magnuspinnatus]|uniref:premelanosome protein a isoform X3 n=1 Tax=Periophthalmus magnuspinnatus TaxID=409849 RepID=UPI0024370C40|nr:premelanosome protein a isoform X3 [Periophthalmus magnuspinnatus]